VCARLGWIGIAVSNESIFTFSVDSVMPVSDDPWDIPHTLRSCLLPCSAFADRVDCAAWFVPHAVSALQCRTPKTKHKNIFEDDDEDGTGFEGS
jgi:hypothetical protein